MEEASAHKTAFRRQRVDDSLFEVRFHNNGFVENGHVVIILPLYEKLDAAEQPLVRRLLSVRKKTKQDGPNRAISLHMDDV